MLGQITGSTLHVLEKFWRRNRNRTFLHDLLMSPLDTAIPAEQRASIAIPVSNKLHLKVPTFGCQFHSKHGGSRHLCLHLFEALLDILSVEHFSNALSTSTPRSLQHDRVSNTLTYFVGLFGIIDAGFLVDIFWYVPATFFVRYADPSPAPTQRGHASSLRENSRTNFVSQSSHWLRRWAKKQNSGLLQCGWQFRKLRRMAPSRPHRVYLCPLSHLHD
mmetsp:Transcript_7720/g.19693  ORF Transcript_7720/g.19693 Transcript_7720/m.19693 type:complete len:218 (+) Transcript_7720:2499-3152(+)